MINRKDELLYVTGLEVVDGIITKENSVLHNHGGEEMVKREEGHTTVTGSKLHKMGVEHPILTYKENGLEIAKGEDTMCVVEDYLAKHLGYNLADLDEYEWRDYPNNTNYEVSELGLVRNKKNGKLLLPSLSGAYEENSKDIWRLRITISGEVTGRLSQVVARTYLGDKPEGDGIDYVVGHKNDIPLDNRAENLEYITPYQNKTIDWVLREVGLRGLTLSYVEDVFEQIKEVVEDKYGLPVDRVGELTKEDAEEVQDYIEVYNRTVQDIYNYKVYGTGVLSRIGVDGDRFII